LQFNGQIRSSSTSAQVCFYNTVLKLMTFRLLFSNIIWRLIFLVNRDACLMFRLGTEPRRVHWCLSSGVARRQVGVRAPEGRPWGRINTLLQSFKNAF